MWLGQEIQVPVMATLRALLQNVDSKKSRKGG